MLKLTYLLPRLTRHFMPDGVIRILLRRGWILQAGKETRTPQAAVQFYQEHSKSKGVSLEGKRVLNFGYGGRLAVGCGLLKAGASHVVLCEKAEFLDHKSNRALLIDYPDFVRQEEDKVLPNPKFITLYHGDIRNAYGEIAPVDVALSWSVFEHLDDVEGITHMLHALTAPGGFHLHVIDLRDHFFKYPFEMLCYSEKMWSNWLDPTSHLNRWRIPGYRQVFESFFSKVEIETYKQDETQFFKTRSRIRPEFLSGDLQLDLATSIILYAHK
jgi:hypothetical protein